MLWDWHTFDVHLSRKRICAVRGSSVVMPCNFTHLPGLKVTKVFWGINLEKKNNFQDIHESRQHKGRVQYFWNKDGNCTLKLSELMMSDNGEYYVIIATPNKSWRSKSEVTLFVKGRIDFY